MAGKSRYSLAMLANQYGKISSGQSEMRLHFHGIQKQKEKGKKAAGFQKYQTRVYFNASF
jgi:uncharacterized membrane protein